MGWLVEGEIGNCELELRQRTNSLSTGSKAAAVDLLDLGTEDRSVAVRLGSGEEQDLRERKAMLRFSSALALELTISPSFILPFTKAY